MVYDVYCIFLQCHINTVAFSRNDVPTYHALYITTNVQNRNTSPSVPRSSPSGNISNLSIDAFQIQKGRFAHHTFTCRSDQVRSGLFFCRRKYKWTSKMIWRSFDNLKKPPRLLYAFSFDGYSASTTALFYPRTSYHT